MTLLTPSRNQNRLVAKWSDMMSGTDSKILDAITRTQRPVNRSVLKIENSKYDYCFTTSTWQWYPIILNNEEEEE